MRHALVATACLALCATATAAATAAQAQSLVSADNPGLTVFTTAVNSDFPLDGNNTVLSFHTGKPNEVVQLDFSGFCGYRQIGYSTLGVPTTGFVQLFFKVDGAIVGEGGSANYLCYWTAMTSGNLQFVGNGVNTRQRFVVATPGVHSIGVLMQSPVSGDSSQIYSMLGQTHVGVSK